MWMQLYHVCTINAWGFSPALDFLPKPLKRLFWSESARLHRSANFRNWFWGGFVCYFVLCWGMGGRRGLVGFVCLFVCFSPPNTNFLKVKSSHRVTSSALWAITYTWLLFPVSTYLLGLLGVHGSRFFGVVEDRILPNPKIYIYIGVCL